MSVLRSLRVGDALAVVFALALALLPLLIARGGVTPTAVISVGGSIVYRAPLSENARIPAGSGNIISIGGGEISMAEARCPANISP